MSKIQEIFLALLFLVGSYVAGTSLAELFVTEPGPAPEQILKAMASEPKQKLSFTLKDENGQEHSFEQAKGKSPALVYFFAADCVHCTKLLKSMSDVRSQAEK